MTAARCRKCSAETVNSRLCVKCVNDLDAVIRELPAALRELEVTLTRQDRNESIAPRTYGAVAEPDDRSPLALISTPWPLSLSAVRELDHVRESMVTVIHDLCEARGLTPPVRGNYRPGEAPVPNLVLARWLATHVEEIAQLDNAGQVAREFDRIHQRAARLVFGNDPDVFLGRCDATDVRSDIVDGNIVPRPGECGVDLYAHHDDTEVTCQACGYVYEVAGRKDAMLEVVYEQIRPVTQVADAVTALLTDDRGETVQCSASMIRGYIHRGRLAYRGTGMVRVGDVVDLLRAKLERDQARRGRKVSA